MNNDELKKKILTIVRGAMLEADELPFIETTDNIADALIATGIGDVKESENKATAAELVAQAAASTAIEKIEGWKHRAEVAESENAALRNEADENAALSIKNKLRADCLEKENAALRERLDAAEARLAELKGGKE